MDNGSESEHVAFLSLWLSRYVFPGNEPDQIGNHIFRIAIYLARGTRLALAPAVLASIYRDMGLLRASMVASTQMEDFDSFLALTLWSPLCYVQIWAWERLLRLHPKPNFMNAGELRLARWKGLKKSDIGNVRPAIDYAGETFLWRPYALAVDNWSIPKLYKEKEEWVVGKDLDCEFESLARCLRVCKLVGVDCEEPYNPHRVAMQFGLDQDLPGWVSRDNTSREMAWQKFCRPLSDDELLYLPPRLSESDVTTRYLEWWRKRVICPANDFKGVVKRQRSSRLPYNPLKQLKTGSSPLATSQPCSKFNCNEGSSCEVQPLPPALFQSVLPQQIGGVTSATRQQPVVKLEEDTKRHNSSYDADVPPGFIPKSIEGKGKCVGFCPSMQPWMQEEYTIQSEAARITRSKTTTDKILQSKLPTTVHYPDVPPGFPPKFKSIERNCNEESSSYNVEPHEMQPRIEQGGLAKGKSVMVEEQVHGSRSGESILVQNTNSTTKSESTRIFELEARLSMLESELARLKK
ncbi:uncharacterized protein Fot_48721 [Forsythia ovata]|uniref:Aminotransferase-like plant mobile domain-containing protein n=1 Tax=Forsythia ovata TaxID=205694 RepID=A0ABD1Q9U7_9LAMI